jgi:hypothetical protein
MIIILFTVKKFTQTHEDYAVLRNKSAINSLGKLFVQCHKQTCSPTVSPCFFQHIVYNGMKMSEIMS